MSESRPIINEGEFTWDERGRLFVPLERSQVPLNVVLLSVPLGEIPRPVALIDLPLLRLRSRGSDGNGVYDDYCIQPGERRLWYELRVYGKLLLAKDLYQSLGALVRGYRAMHDYGGEEHLLASRRDLENKLRIRAEQ